ncbi:MAG: MFS transporter, partial [Desulfatitalea sp.]
VTGVAVAGFGGGAALVSHIGAWRMHSHGATPFETFQMLGLIFMLLVVAAGMCMRNPPGTRLAVHRALSWRQIVTQREFRILYLAMGCGLAAGFAVNANLKELYTGGSLKAGVSAVAAFAMANAAGRILWGWGFDRFGGRVMVSTNLLLQAAVLALSPWILISPAGLLLFAVLTGFNYGGVLVLYASSVALHWGSANVGQVYGLLFSANILAALAPLAAGLLFDASASFLPALWGLAGLLIIALLLFLRAPWTPS